MSGGLVHPNLRRDLLPTKTSCSSEVWHHEPNNRRSDEPLIPTSIALYRPSACSPYQSPRNIGSALEVTSVSRSFDLLLGYSGRVRYEQKLDPRVPAGKLKGTGRGLRKSSLPPSSRS